MQEGANAKRCNGYQVYHMPDVMSKNVLNYAMRYENLVNYNYSSQMFICSFIITHTSHTQTTPETVYFKEFSSENSHAACAKPLATDKTLCK